MDQGSDWEREADVVEDPEDGLLGLRWKGLNASHHVEEGLGSFQVRSCLIDEPMLPLDTTKIQVAIQSS